MFHSITPVEINGPLTGNNAWRDIDVSAHVPAGATGVVLRMRIHASITSQNVGFRKNGSTFSQTAAARAGQLFQVSVGVDSSRIFEYYDGSYFNAIFKPSLQLIGYYTEGVVFPTNAVMHPSADLTTSWKQAGVVSSFYGDDDPTGLFINLIGMSDWDTYGIRMTGSTDDRVPAAIVQDAAVGGILIGLSETNTVESQYWTVYPGIAHAAGYVTEGVQYFKEAIEVTPSWTSQWVNPDYPSQPGAKALILQFTRTDNSTTTDWGVREGGGAGGSYIGRMGGQAWCLAPLDSFGNTEVYRGSSEVKIWVHGIVGVEPGPDPDPEIAEPDSINTPTKLPAVSGATTNVTAYPGKIQTESSLSEVDGTTARVTAYPHTIKTESSLSEVDATTDVTAYPGKSQTSSKLASIAISAVKAIASVGVNRTPSKLASVVATGIRAVAGVAAISTPAFAAAPVPVPSVTAYPDGIVSESRLPAVNVVVDGAVQPANIRTPGKLPAVGITDIRAFASVDSTQTPSTLPTIAVSPTAIGAVQGLTTPTRLPSVLIVPELEVVVGPIQTPTKLSAVPAAPWALSEVDSITTLGILPAVDVGQPIAIDSIRTPTRLKSVPVVGQADVRIQRIRSRCRLIPPNPHTGTYESTYETIPYRADIPESILTIPGSGRDLYEYLREQTAILREQHLKIQTGQTTLPFQNLTQLYDEEVFSLGATGRFLHPIHGIIRGVFVRFTEMADAPSGGPVGYPEGAESVDWTVTNDFARSNPMNVVGFIASSTLPADGQYGWVITQGANLLPVGIFDESISQGNELTWAGINQLSAVEGGVRIARQYIGAVRDKATGYGPGELIIDVASSMGRELFKEAEERLDGIHLRLEDAEALIQYIQEAFVTEDEALAGTIARVEARVDENAAAIRDEASARASGDEVLASRIATVSAAVTDRVLGEIRQEASVRASEDSAIISMLDTARAEINDELTGVEKALSELSNQTSVHASELAAAAINISRATARIEYAELDIIANAEAVSSLSSEVTNLDGEISALSSAVTGLGTRITDAEQELSSHGLALSSLTSSVNQHGEDIISLSQDIVDLENAIQDIGAGTTLFEDKFEYLNGNEFLDAWFTISTSLPANQITRITDPTAPAGYALRFGTNSGNNRGWFGRPDARFTINPEKLYEVGITYRQVAGDSVNLYCGFTAFNAAGDPVNVNGSITYSSQHFVASNRASPPGTWRTQRGYISGFGTPAGTNGEKPNPSDPGVFRAEAVTAEPVVILNQNGSGTIDIAHIWVREIAGNYAAFSSAVDSLTSQVSNLDGEVTAVASSVSSLSTTVGGHTTSISQLTTSVNGIKARWGVQIDSGNIISGYIRMDGGQGYSEINMRANKIRLYNNASGNIYPFEIVGGTVYIKEAMIRTLNASKITAGTITADRFLTNQGVDLAALVPGQFNFKARDIVTTPVTLALNYSNPIPANPADVTVSNHIVDLEIAVTLSLPGGGTYSFTAMELDYDPPSGTNEYAVQLRYTTALGVGLLGWQFIRRTNSGSWVTVGLPDRFENMGSVPAGNVSLTRLEIRVTGRFMK